MSERWKQIRERVTSRGFLMTTGAVCIVAGLADLVGRLI